MSSKPRVSKLKIDPNQVASGLGFVNDDADILDVLKQTPMESIKQKYAYKSDNLSTRLATEPQDRPVGGLYTDNSVDIKEKQ